jgi:phthalate 4,5-dioxygenase oxygenase subunit
MDREQNEILCRIGPGTPMGEVMRRYWQPALLSSDLPHPDCAPKHLRLLGEDFVAFRDSKGRIGVLDEGCAHRGTSLTLGRVEDCGIRCLFHGWHFAVDGTILDMPNATDPRLKQQFKAKAYPAREAGDLIWVYLGPPEKEPPFREFEFMTVPAENRFVVRRDMDCNYLQVLEGGLDSAHVPILHADVNRTISDGSDQREFTSGIMTNVFEQANPKLDVRETDFGFDYAAFRPLGGSNDGDNVRVTPFIMPNMVMIPPNTHTILYLPYDDTHTGWVVAFWNKQKTIDRERQIKIMGLDQPGVWVNDKLMLNRGNNFLQSREKMARGSWTGMNGFTLEDSAVSMSMGEMYDRSREHLVPTDIAIVRARRLFLESMRRVQSGQDPIGLAPHDTLAIRAAEGEVPTSQSWHGIVPGHRASTIDLND